MCTCCTSRKWPIDTGRRVYKKKLSKKTYTIDDYFFVKGGQMYGKTTLINRYFEKR